MNSQSMWIIIIGGMIVTYIFRSSFIVFLKNGNIPIVLFRSLRFTPAVVLSALIMQMLVKNGEAVQLSVNNPRIIAGIIAIIIAWKFHNTWLTLITGMCSLWLFTFIIK